MTSIPATDSSRFKADEAAVVAVEFALFSPVILVMAIGILNFAQLTNHRLDLDRAIRAAANVAVLSPPMNGDFSHIQEAFDYAARAADGRSFSVSTSCECGGGGVVACDSGCADGSDRQVLVTIAVTEDYELMIPMPVFGARMPITSTVTVRVA